MPVPNTFANATTSIPLSQLDANFATAITLGNTAIQLGNTVSTLNNMTLANVTLTGVGTFAAGSNTAPSITTAGDTNTGIFFPAADTIAFSEGGAESMRIDSSGNVGIGTSSPSAKLDVNGNTNITGTVVMSSSFLRNRIINGDMRIDQRNAGASVTGSTTNPFSVDRWQTVSSQNSKFTAQQNAGSVTPPAGFINYLGITSSSAYSIVAADQFRIFQSIEGLNVADLAWGTANAATVTLSFRVYSSLTGTFGGSLANNGYARSYPFTYTISTANTWTTISVTVAGDTSGTWLTTNGNGVIVSFGLGVGSTLSGTAGAWATASYVSATGATSVVGTNGATFYITGVQLEVGTAATPFERRQYGQELALCQRYYNRDVLVAVGGGATPASTNRTFFCSVNWPVAMRAAPTMTLISTLASSNMNAGAWVNLTTSRGRFSATNSVANDCALEAQYSADIEL